MSEEGHREDRRRGGERLWSRLRAGCVFCRESSIDSQSWNADDSTAVNHCLSAGDRYECSQWSRVGNEGKGRREGWGGSARGPIALFIMTNSHMQSWPAAPPLDTSAQPPTDPPPKPQKPKTEDTPEPCLRTPNTSRGPALPPPSRLALSARLNLNLKSRSSAAAESLVGIERDIAVFIRALCLRITALTRVRL